VGSLERRAGSAGILHPGNGLRDVLHDQRLPGYPAVFQVVLDVRPGEPDRIGDSVVGQFAFGNEIVDRPRRNGEQVGGLANRKQGRLGCTVAPVAASWGLDSHFSHFAQLAYPGASIRPSSASRR
jgi:hypothetical protein